MSKQIPNNEQGNVMILALLVFMALSVLTTAVVSLAVMENRMSRYSLIDEQAWQAADAGAVWAQERIFNELTRQRNIEQLPNLMLLPEDVQVSTDLPIATASIGTVEKVAQSSDECIYRFTSTGNYQGMNKAIQVEVRYVFAGGYNNEQGVFIPRTYRDRGKICSYNCSQ